MGLLGELRNRAILIKRVIARMSQFVLPGEFITVEEEFSAGQNVYLEDDGRIFADCVGSVVLDEETRTVHVRKASRSVKPLDAGSIVLGRVGLVKDSQVLVDFISANRNGLPRALTQSSGTIMVSRAAQGYLARLKDYFKSGDLVSARVLEIKPWGVELATNEADLGVVLAFCGNCKQVLTSLGKEMICPDCENVEIRKTSQRYASFEDAPMAKTN